MSPLTISAIVVVIMMLGMWFLSLRLRDASIIDMVWGMGFVLIAWSVFFLAGEKSQLGRSLLLPLLVSLWGIRLSLHLFLRNHGRPEDYRYQQMRNGWGPSFWWISLLTVFGLQGVIMWVVSLPLQLGIAASLGSGDAAAATMGLGLQLAGCGLWVIGLFFETVGDWQLTKFKANSDNRGRVLDTGLWRYTRHPNYFGDCLVWWGFFLIAFGLGGPAWTIIGPLVMTILLLKVSGVALLEKSLSANKPGYAEYVRRTSSFFPLPPKIL